MEGLLRYGEGNHMRHFLLSVVVLALAAAGCSGAAGDGKGGDPIDPNATIRIAASDDEWPRQGTDAESTTFAYPLNVNVYEPLIRLAPDYSLQPGLATRWELVDGKTWRFNLRRGVTFHDGSQLTADDVLWTWAVRQQEGQTLATVTDTLGPDSVRKVDEYTVDFTPEVPNLRLPQQIVHPEGAIVPEGKHFDSTPPVGTGPFRVASYRPNEKVELDRFEGYWGTKPNAKRLEFRFLPDSQTRLQALQAGNVDVVLDPNPESVPSLETGSRFRVVRSEPGRAQLIYIKIHGKDQQPLGSDPAVREAVSLAIDRRSYVEVAFAGNAAPGRWMGPKSVLGPYADRVAPVPFDPDRARRVLDAAGWREGPGGIRVKDGRDLSLRLIGWAEVSDTSFGFLQSQLRNVGIDVEVSKAPDNAAFTRLRESGNYDLNLEVPNQNDGNPAFLPVLRFYSPAPISADYAPGARFDDVAEQALAAEGSDGVQQAAAEMMRILANEEYIVVPLAGMYRIYAMTRDVEFAGPHPSQTSQLWTGLAKHS